MHLPLHSITQSLKPLPLKTRHSLISHPTNLRLASASLVASPALFFLYQTPITQTNNKLGANLPANPYFDAISVLSCFLFSRHANIYPSPPR